jgi:hypothetical protein
MMFFENSLVYTNISLNFASFQRLSPNAPPLVLFRALRFPLRCSLFSECFFSATKIAKKLPTASLYETHHVCIIAAPRPTPALFFRVHLAQKQHLQESGFKVALSRERRRRRRYVLLFCFVCALARAFWNFILNVIRVTSYVSLETQLVIFFFSLSYARNLLFRAR